MCRIPFNSRKPSHWILFGGFLFGCGGLLLLKQEFRLFRRIVVSHSEHPVWFASLTTLLLLAGLAALSRAFVILRQRRLSRPNDNA
jgi:hypothetical protein